MKENMPLPLRTYLYATTAEQWRQWLKENGRNEREMWLLFPRKATGLPRISYVEALEEALCFGWIDGMVRRYEESFLSQRLSPRSQKSSWSEVNKQHARLLIQKNKMADAGYATLPDLSLKECRVSEDILDVLRHDGEVWKNFCAFPIYYRNIRLMAIEKCRDYPERFHRLLRHFVEQTRRNRRYGRFH
jgi:hypothetical protein